AGNEQAGSTVEAHFPHFIAESSQRGIDSIDGRLLDNAVANLTRDNDDTRLKGLLSIAELGPVSIDAIPALSDFISQTNREDLKVYAEKLLSEIDPNFVRERE